MECSCVVKDVAGKALNRGTSPATRANTMPDNASSLLLNNSGVPTNMRLVLSSVNSHKNSSPSTRTTSSVPACK